LVPPTIPVGLAPFAFGSWVAPLRIAPANIVSDAADFSPPGARRAAPLPVLTPACPLPPPTPPKSAVVPSRRLALLRERDLGQTPPAPAARPTSRAAA
jgi:hypothetical protein